MLYHGWKHDRKFKKWCQFAFRHALYPLTIDEKYLRQFIDWNKEWKRKYGIDLEKL